MAKSDLSACCTNSEIHINTAENPDESKNNCVLIKEDKSSDPGVLQEILSSDSLTKSLLQIVQSKDQSIQPIQISASLQTVDRFVVISEPASTRDNDSIRDNNSSVWQVIPTKNNSTITHIIAINPSTESFSEEGENQEYGEATSDSFVGSSIPIVYISSDDVKQSKVPSWAHKLIDCEVLGNSYRGWVRNESDLFLVLTFHKQQTSSTWGTRQSPSSQCPSQRLMWKSQYVPFDGIPFINLGSRAIVMECQYGPRRKRNAFPKKPCDLKPKRAYMQTCPARIYVKKVQKFPEFVVNITLDKKNLRTAMDQAFHNLKTKGLDGHGETRWYVQLPTEAAHSFHESLPSSEIHTENTSLDEAETNLTVHPCIIERINHLVQNGEGRVYVIRKHLRKYVEKKMFQDVGKVPEKHNLVYFPTVNNIQNHVYQALQDIQSGKLPLFVQSVILDPMTDEKGGAHDDVVNASNNGSHVEALSDLPENGGSALTVSFPDEKNFAHSVTVTFTQPEEGALPVISRVETKMQDGSIQVSTTLTPQSSELLSKLTPEVFPPSKVIQVAEEKDETGVPVSNEEAV